MRLKKKIRISADFLIGGEGGDRTLDPRLMSPLLYRLSYLAPCSESNGWKYIKTSAPKSIERPLATLSGYLPRPDVFFSTM